VFVPKTPPEGFTMGNGEPGESNQKHPVVLTRSFCMDATEVTVAAYRSCFDRGECTQPEWRDVNSNFMLPDHEQHPVNMVTWDQALHYCKLRGQDLPTEAQFEWAAGQGRHRYPWGDEDPTCENELADFTPGGAPKSNPAGDVGCRGGNTSPVKAHPKGKTSWPTGDIFDLGGNVWEWTKDCAYPYAATKQIDPYRAVHPFLGDHCYVYSLRGGGWNRSKYALRVYYRGASRHTYHVPGLGFRCVRNSNDAPSGATPGNEPDASP
jgi:formylglycine-generating enzyme required for sulfatase activity